MAVLFAPKVESTIAKVSAVGLFEGRAALLLVVGALVFFGLSAWAGAIVEGLTDLTIRKSLKNSASNPKIAERFLKKKLYETFALWRREFRKAATAHGAYAVEGFPLDKKDRSLAVGIFFDDAKPEHVTWLVGHYAMFVLASNFAFLTIVIQLYLFFPLVSQSLSLGAFLTWELILGLFVLYPLCSLAVDRYLYSHEVCLRHATVALRRETQSRSEKEESQQEDDLQKEDPKRKAELERTRNEK